MFLQWKQVSSIENALAGHDMNIAGSHPFLGGNHPPSPQQVT
jgi:hypothetical protein